MLLNKWKFAKVLLLLPMLFFSFSAFAQKSVSGTVTAASDGQPLPGVNVLVQGTTQGTITDFDGKYQLSVSEGQTLVFTFVGFTNQNVVVGGQNVYDVILEEETSDLDEVVVVGYGVQKKKLVTGATVQVKGDDLQKLSTTSALTAMQSQTPGVVIQQNSGQAGEGFKVNIRGLGTVGNSAPLYVVDGVAGGDINTLNPSDIESIDVLKDAASSAIYGARAANGVILITTKQGKSGKLVASYDGYVGWQYMYKKPDVLDAQEWIYSRKLRQVNGGSFAEPKWEKYLPKEYYDKYIVNKEKGTNWIDESYHEGALTQNHAFNISGGTDVSKFALGYSYTSQDGILGGVTPSEYDRHTARLNSDHVLLKSADKSFDVITVGETMNYSRTTRRGISQGNMYWNNVKDLLLANPLIPVYNEEGNFYTQDDVVKDGWGLEGAPNNPIYMASKTGHGLNKSISWTLLTSAFLNIQPIKGLNIKSQFGYRMGSSSYRSMTAQYKTAGQDIQTETINQSVDLWSNMTWENTISYSFNANENNFDVVVGQAIEQNKYGEHLDASAKNSLFGDSWNHAWISNTERLDLSEINMHGNPTPDNSLASFFGRLSWNYKEKYMAQFTLRADGSSNFARGNRWGYFPSGSLGWVLSQEDFMQDLSGVVDFLKIRGSWGQNGNCSVSNFQYVTSVSFDTNNSYFFGLNDGGTYGNNSKPTTGGYSAILRNPDISWETSEQLNLGLDARFLNSRLSLAFDWYKKSTKDWLVQAPILGVYGLGAPYINGGDVENKGVELSLSWNDQLDNGLSYGITVNGAYNKNEVTKLANSEGILRGPNAVWHQTNSEEIYRAQIGKPIGFFYGLKTNGILQNDKDVQEYRAAYNDTFHGSDLRPGDVRFVDTNNDDQIDEKDRVMIGDPTPDVTMGLTITLGYKGFDFSLTGSGAFGHQIVRTWANQDFQPHNLTKKILYGSWKGEGTSNSLPRLDSMDSPNWHFSDMMLEDADYFKCQNITLGYDFKTIWKSNNPFQQIRLYVTAQNLFTITNYTGMDPEVGMEGGSGNAWAKGIDTGAYPSARTYMVGLNLKF